MSFNYEDIFSSFRISCAYRFSQFIFSLIFTLQAGLSACGSGRLTSVGFLAWPPFWALSLKIVLLTYPAWWISLFTNYTIRV